MRSINTKNLPLTDKLICDSLKEAKKPLSTYDVAKIAKLAWGTAITHCYKLKSMGIIDSKEEDIKTNMKRTVWWLK